MTKAGSEAESSQPVILANALANVCAKADDWRSLADLYKFTRKGQVNIGRPVTPEDIQQARCWQQNCKKAFFSAIDAALAAVPGVDKYVRPITKTAPAEWTSQLKARLNGFRADVQQLGPLLVTTRAEKYWERIEELREWQRLLRNIDISAVGKDDKTGGTNAASGVASPAPYMPAGWFSSKYGIPHDRLRAARRDRRLSSIKEGHRYRYSVPGAQRLWPDDGIETPDMSG